MKKILCAMAILVIGNTLSADNNVIYQNGVKDTLLIGSRYVKDVSLITNQNTNIVLSGHGVLLDVSSFPESKIIQASAIGVKNGLDIKYISFNDKDYIVFATEKREADAMFLVKRLGKYGISANIEKLKGSYTQTTLVAHDLIDAINDTLAYLSSRKDNKINKLNALLTKKGTINTGENFEPIESKKNTMLNQNNYSNQEVVINLDNVQVVNRVVTDSYLKRYKKTSKTIAPYSSNQRKNLTKKKRNEQIKKVSKNIKNDSRRSLPKIKSFSKIYKYLRSHGAITSNNKLLLHKKLYKVGDTLFQRKISSINHSIGVVVIGNDYVVTVNKK
ncbi:hypothetical protein [Poseidonibacter ostreae]|uniref:Uncharacterized protein n=1 Tax=Poseidonibacter ostreae TaxID=2654171 RepID=A0A6L4WWQ3_9BACT|nr:hypothetical protein [Poseidonibacter ostreae]KAB7891311.1 hypothetical protein GBG19_00310 [Poseidonibacter ostreae]